MKIDVIRRLRDGTIRKSRESNEIRRMINSELERHEHKREDEDR